MAGKEESSGGVSIGSVGGDIVGSIITAGDVSNVTVTVGNKEMSAGETPTVEEFKQLLAEIQAELAEITAQQDALQAVSADAPFTAQGAEANVNQAATEVEGEVDEEQAESVQKSLKKATSLLGGILDSAKTVAQKSVEVAEAVKPIAERLEPLVEKLGVAALWAAKLWLQG